MRRRTLQCILVLLLILTACQNKQSTESTENSNTIQNSAVPTGDSKKIPDDPELRYNMALDILEKSLGTSTLDLLQEEVSKEAKSKVKNSDKSELTDLPKKMTEILDSANIKDNQRSLVEEFLRKSIYNQTINALEPQILHKGLQLKINEIAQDSNGNLSFELSLTNGTEKSITLDEDAVRLELIDGTFNKSPNGIARQNIEKSTNKALKVSFNTKYDDIVSLIVYNHEGERLYRLLDLPKPIQSTPTPSTATIASTSAPADQLFAGAVKADGAQFDELVRNYETSLAEAINTGDFSKVEFMLLKESSLYNDQKKLVADLSKRGISEELVSYEIKDAKMDDKNKTLYLTVWEEIKIIKPDSKPTTNEYTWLYTVKQDDQGVFKFSNIQKP